MPNSVGGNGAKRKLAEAELVLCMGVVGVRQDFEFSDLANSARDALSNRRLGCRLHSWCWPRRREAAARGAASVESRDPSFLNGIR